jgi:hypothetical protein
MYSITASLITFATLSSVNLSLLSLLPWSIVACSLMVSICFNLSGSLSIVIASD